MNANFHRAALAVGMRKLFEDKHFFVSDFDTLAKLAGVHVPTKDYQALRALHCVKYADMPPDVRRQLFDMVTSLLCAPPTFDLESIEPVRALTAPCPSIGTTVLEVPAPPKKKRFGIF